MASVLVLGGGVGGVASAVRLRQRLSSEHEITLLDRRQHFTFGFRKTWALLGRSSLAEGQRPLKSLERLGIQVRQAEVERIDPERRTVAADGRDWQADYLVIALGAQADAAAVPGFVEHGLSFYSPESIDDAAAGLARFSAGRVAIAVLGVPHPCPPAPFEAALLLREHFESAGTPADIDVYSPLPMSLPVLGESGCSAVESRLEQHGVSFHPNQVPQRVESGRIVFQTGPAAFDLLIGVPGHVCPEPLVAAGLAQEGGWVEVDPRTLQTSYQGVFAIGDAVSIPLADGKRLPKAGVFAEAQAKVAADRIAAAIDGQAATASFDGFGYCFLEVGNQSAMLVQGDFLAEPRPKVDLVEPAPKHLADKYQYEADRLAAWFGSQ